MPYTTALLGMLLLAGPDADSVLSIVDKHADQFKKISRQIWESPELGFHETKSAGVLRDALRGAGFRITDNVAGLPTAFIAEWGSGSPVIGIIGEYDALPGLSQQDKPMKEAIAAGAPGHGCGHNLFGSASALAAVAVKEQLQAKNIKGTLRFYGTPAEEGGAGKVYMIRAGVFRDADAMLAWHPWDVNQADENPWLANVSAHVRFYGTAAHAAGSPEAGRSALDAVEVMTHAVNLMREHVPQETRLHYIITKGGSAANIVPDFAELHIIARHPNQKVLEGIWERVANCAQAGALATGTRMEMETASAYSNMIVNPALRDLLDRNLHTVGGFSYTPEEAAFAEQVRKTVNGVELPPLDQVQQILPPRRQLVSVSTDVGDVSWNVATGHLFAATLPPGVPLHSWQSTACTGTEIGRKGMMVAAKTLALSASELFANPKLVDAAKADFQKAISGKTYRSMLPEGKKPPL